MRKILVLLSFALLSAAPAPPPTRFTPDYAWKLFLTLNAPLTGTAPKTWETTYRGTSSVYLPDGSKPAAWGTNTTPSAAAKNPAPVGSPCASTSTLFHDLDTSIQVDGKVLLDKWNVDVRYQLLMNRDTFDYILARGFYNTNGQEAAAKAKKPANFPAAAAELKTSWLWLGTDASKCQAVAGKYYVVNAYYRTFDRDGKPTGWASGRAALTGFHIINKQLPQWVFITFENVNNPSFTQIKLQLPLPADVQAANAKYQQQLKAQGSVFANYQLDFIQTEFTANGQPTLSANSNIESAFQPVSSCITCHHLASIKADGTYFNLVDPKGGSLNYYTGVPPDTTKLGYTNLDVVWSMKRASRSTGRAKGGKP